MAEVKRNTKFQGASYPRVNTTQISNVPPNRVSLEAVRQGIGNAELAIVIGSANGDVVHTTYASAPGDAGGGRWQWDSTSTSSGPTYLGSELVGRWVKINDPTGGAGASFTGPSVSFTASGTINTSGIVDAAFFAIVPTSDNLIARGLTPPSGASNINVRHAFNNSNFTVIIPNEDTGASASARHLTDDATTKVWPKKTWVTFAYDSTASRYRVRQDKVSDGLVISDLATRSISKNGEAVTVAGRAARGDGTGFAVTGELGATDTVDNVNVFSAPNGRYKRTHGFGRNLKFGRDIDMQQDFGVFADGTDQRQRIQDALDWWDAAASAAIAAQPNSSVKQVFRFPGHGNRAVQIYGTLNIPGGNHKYLEFAGDGYFCPHADPYGNSIWNSEYAVAGSVIQAAGGSAGTFDLFTFTDPYTYIDFTRMALGNRGNGACLNMIGAFNHIVVSRVDDVFVYGAKHGYWAQSTVSCLSNYDLHARGCDTAIRLGNRDLTDFNREAWDVRFKTLRIESCNNSIKIDAAASVHVEAALIQNNVNGIVAHSDYAMTTCSFSLLHMEGNSGGDFQVPEFTTNPSGVNQVLLKDSRLVSPNGNLVVPFGWNFHNIRCDSITWPEAYGPNRATVSLRNVSVENRSATVDFSSGHKRVIGSIPTRFTKTKKRYRITISGSANGTYQILVNAVSRATFTASSNTTQQIRDDLMADLRTWGAGVTAVSTNAIDVDSPLYDGAAFVVTQSSTGSAITVGAALDYIELDALAVGNFIEIDSIAQAFTLFAPMHAPQGFQAWIRFRQNGTGGYAITPSGFSYGTQRYTDSGNGANTETWWQIAFDDLDQWGILQAFPWIGSSYDPAVLISNKLTVNTTNASNTPALSSAAIVCENPAGSGQSIFVWSFAGTVKSSIRASFGGHLSTTCDTGTYQQFMGGAVALCNMSASGLTVGGVEGTAATGQLFVSCQSTSRVVAKIKAIASQTADVLQVETSSGTGDLFAVDANGVPCFSTEAGITASTTQTQVGARQLTKHTNQIATVANVNDAVKLPLARDGAECVIISYGGNTLQVFPASGDQIDGLGLNVSTTIATGGHAVFRAFDNTNWRKM